VSALSGNKRCAISWAKGDTTYYLRHNGGTEEGILRGHGTVAISCSAIDDGRSCTQWSASPTGTVGLYAKATRGRSTEIYVTTVTMPFQMTLTKK